MGRNLCRKPGFLRGRGEQGRYGEPCAKERWNLVYEEQLAGKFN